MTRIILTAFIGMIAGLRSLTAIAQPTLTAATSTPTAGTTVQMLVKTSTNGTTSFATSSGANQTWDLSGLSFIRRTDSLNFHTCGSSDDCGRYAGTTILSSHPQVNGVAYDYYAGSSTVLSYLGNNDSVAGAVYHHIYTDPQDRLRFPMTYGGSFADSFAILDTATNGATAHFIKGNDTVLADAWGSLKTPSGTFANTLRVMEIINLRDSSRSPMGSPTIAMSTYTVYSWYDASHPYTLAQITEFEFAPGSFASYGSYADVTPAPTGITPLVGKGAAFSLVPNPAHSNVTLSLRLTATSHIDVAIAEMTGRIVYRAKYPSLAAGDNKIVLQTQGWPAGFYAVHINGDNTASTATLVIR